MFFHEKKGGMSSSLTFSNPEAFVFERSRIAEASKEIVGCLTELTIYLLWLLLKQCVESFYMGKKGEGSTPTALPPDQSLHQICEDCCCVQDLIQCQILLMSIFCSLLSKFSNHLIYSLLVSRSNFLSCLNSCPGDLPNDGSYDWNESCLQDADGTSN